MKTTVEQWQKAKSGLKLHVIAGVARPETEFVLDLISDLEELQAIVDTLPKTVDGVPITIDMEVWFEKLEGSVTMGDEHISANENIECAVVVGIEGGNSYQGRIFFPESPQIVDRARWTIPERCYSTREAAEAALKENS